MSQNHWEAVPGSRRDAKMAEIEFERQYPFVKVAARLPMNPSPSTPCVALLRNESFSMQVIRRLGFATIHLSMYESPPFELVHARNESLQEQRKSLFEWILWQLQHSSP